VALSARPPYSRPMTDLTDDEFEAAEARGRELMATEPRAKSARYERESGLLVVELVDGSRHAVDVSLMQELRDAAPDDLAVIEMGPEGISLHWPRLEADVYVPGFARGIYGTKAWMRQLRDEGRLEA